MRKITFEKNDKVDTLPDGSYVVAGVPSTDGTRLTYKIVSKDGLNGEVIPSAIQGLTDGATVTMNYLSGYNASITLAGNRTLAITNTVDGDSGLIFITQDGTGSRTLTLPSGSLVLGGGSGAITLTTDAGAIDALAFMNKGGVFIFSLNTNAN